MKKFNVKKIGVIALAAASILTSNVMAKTFPDVNSDYSWAQSSIGKLSDKGIINGFADGKYYPAKFVSFEETMQLIFGILNPTTSEISTARDKYSDTVKNQGVSSWAVDAVSYALEKGVISTGTLSSAKENGFFETDESKRFYPARKDIAIFYAKALGMKPDGNTSLLKHDDLDKLNDTTKGYLANLVKVGVFTATGSDGKFEGDRGITRAEMAIITDKAYENKGKVAEKTVEGTVDYLSEAQNIKFIVISVNGTTTKQVFNFDNSTKFKDGNKFVSISDVKPGMRIKVTYGGNNDSNTNGTASLVEILAPESHKYVGYIDYINSNDKWRIGYRELDRNIDYTANGITVSKTNDFNLASNVSIYRLGEDVLANRAQVGDLIEFDTDNLDRVISVDLFPESGSVKGKLVRKTTPTHSIPGSIVLKLKNNRDYTFYVTYDNMNKSNGRDENNFFTNLKEGNEYTVSLKHKNVISFGDNLVSKSDVEGRITFLSVPGRFGTGANQGRIELESTGYNSSRRVYYITTSTRFIDPNGKDITNEVLNNDYYVRNYFENGSIVKVDISEDNNRNEIAVNIKATSTSSYGQTFTARVTLDGYSYDNDRVTTYNLYIGNRLVSQSEGQAYKFDNIELLQREYRNTGKYEFDIEGRVTEEPAYGRSGILRIDRIIR